MLLLSHRDPLNTRIQRKHYLAHQQLQYNYNRKKEAGQCTVVLFMQQLPLF